MPKKTSKKSSVSVHRSLIITKLDKILFLIVFAFFILLIPGQNIYTVFGIPALSSDPPPKIVIPTPAPFPKNINKEYPGNSISAEGIYVQDVNSAVVLYKKNEHIQLAPASTTKIMTALVAYEKFKLNDVIVVKTVMKNGQGMGLVSGEQMSFENMLHGLLIESGNDAAYTLAENYPGGVEAFVKAMNQKAVDLHMEKSHFTNPMGFDDANHYVTPKDLAFLARYAIQNPVIKKIVGIPQITISDISHTRFHPLSNINQLLGKIPGVAGIKTGWTEEAGESLITLVERDGHKVIIVLLKSKDRFGETAKLIDWIFSSYEWIDIKPTIVMSL